ncbi:hypothetical protein M3J09_008345 [Ascochyta lentis]
MPPTSFHRRALNSADKLLAVAPCRRLLSTILPLRCATHRAMASSPTSTSVAILDIWVVARGCRERWRCTGDGFRSRMGEPMVVLRSGRCVKRCDSVRCGAAWMWGRKLAS